MCETLKKRNEFVRVAQEGCVYYGKFVIVRARISESQKIRVGYTASRRVGGAVARNFCKRRMRHLVRLSHVCERWKNDFGADYVFIAQQSMIKAPWKDVCYDFECSIRAVDAKMKRRYSRSSIAKEGFST